MNRLRLSIATAVFGFTLLTVSVLLGFFAAHDWFGYERSVLFELWEWWVQAAGIVLSIVGGIGLLANLAPRATRLMGMAMIVTGFILCLAFGTFILEIHDWGIVLAFPVLFLFVSGAVFVIIAFMRDRKARRSP